MKPTLVNITECYFEITPDMLTTLWWHDNSLCLPCFPGCWRRLWLLSGRILVASQHRYSAAV